MEDIESLLRSSVEDEVIKGLNLLKEELEWEEESEEIDEIENSSEAGSDEEIDLKSFFAYQDRLDELFVYQEDLLSIAKNIYFLSDTRLLALDMAVHINPSNDDLHRELIQICSLDDKDDIIALKVAELFAICSYISDIEVIEDMQWIILNYYSRRVRMEMKASLDIIIDCHGLSEELEVTAEDDILDVCKYLGYPEELGDALTIREMKHQEKKRYDIFISFASEDRDNIVEPLIKELKSKGIKVWYDKEKIETGDYIRETIFDGIDRTKCTLAIISESYLSKQWTLLEFKEIISLWHTCKIPFLPLLRGVPLEKLIDINNAFTYLKCGYIDENTIHENTNIISTYLHKNGK